MPTHVFFLGTVLLLCAFLLSLIVSVSLPASPILDIVRCHFTGDAFPRLSTDNTAESIREIRFGIWAYCIYDSQSGQRTCINPGHGYTVQLESTSNDITIGAGATRGLVVHPVAAGATFIALLLSLSSHVTLAMFASLLSFIAALLTLIAIAIDITLYTIVHDRVHNLDGVQVRSVVAPGVWVTLASLVLLLMAGCTGWLGRRRSRMAGATDYLTPEKQGFFSGLRPF